MRRSERKLKILLDSREGGILLHTEGGRGYDHDMRQLVAKGLIKLIRNGQLFFGHGQRTSYSRSYRQRSRTFEITYFITNVYQKTNLNTTNICIGARPSAS